MSGRRGSFPDRLDIVPRRLVEEQRTDIVDREQCHSPADAEGLAALPADEREVDAPSGLDFRELHTSGDFGNRTLSRHGHSLPLVPSALSNTRLTDVSSVCAERDLKSSSIQCVNHAWRNPT